MKVILAILDGYGLAPAGKYNAVTEADTPFLDKLWNENPTVKIKTSGLDVGLPAGQMGNSEVGHLNIGAGRVVYQDITRINRSIETGEFFSSQVLSDLINDLKSRNRALHLFGLISNGGVHSSIQHLFAILEFCRRHEFRNVILHAFTDGRDTPPHSGIDFIGDVESEMKRIGVGKIATVIGRYYAMDRDRRWPRIEKAYRAICHTEGHPRRSAEDAIQASYTANITDEFIEPAVISGVGEFAKLTSEDAVFFFNFRADRTRQLTNVLTDPSFAEFPVNVHVSRFITMTQYHENYTFPVLFPPVRMHKLLGEIVFEAGLSQLRIAETEKYPHVTFFFNGGIDHPYPKEDRILVPSPKVATYDLQPEMSAPEVTQKLCDAIRSAKYELIVVNFANCDMVGHTGVLSAAIKAVETVNDSVNKMCAAASEQNYAILLTADHGNAEQMWDEKTNGPHTAHTTNLVPLALIGAPKGISLRDGGRLADLAPTILELMQLKQPAEMTGESLLLH